MSGLLQQQVFLVDDDEAVRDALQLLLRASGLPVQAFASAEAFLDSYHPEQGGCLLADLRMPGMTGLKLQDELLARRIRLPIIFVSAHGDIPTAVDVVKKGALEFIEKPVDDERLLRLVREALALDERMRRDMTTEAAAEARLKSLSRRERQVLERILAGKTSQVIAGELFISIKTVGFHRGRIMQKLQVATYRDLLRVYLGANSEVEN